jgi:hypothetical protein
VAVVKPAPPPVRVDEEAEALRLLVDGPEGERPCVGTIDGLPCPKPAVWGMECSGCGLYGQACDGHREWVDRRAEHGIRQVCVRCRAPFPIPHPWVPL